MKKKQAKELVSKLCSGSRVEPDDLSSWLLDSTVWFDRPVTDMSIFNDSTLPENFIEKTDHVLEHYSSGTVALCKALGYAWTTDLYVAIVIIERLLSLHTWDFTGNDVSYDIILNKLCLLRYLSEI